MSGPLLAFIDGPEGLVVVVALLLVLGANRLPKLARQLGQAQRELKKGIQEGAADDRPTGGDVTARPAEPAPVEPDEAPHAQPDAVAASEPGAAPTPAVFQPPLPPPPLPPPPV